MGSLLDPSLMVTLPSCLIAGCDAQRCCPRNTLGGTLRLTPLRRSVREPGASAGAILHKKGRLRSCRVAAPLRQATRMLLNRSWRRPDGQITCQRPGTGFRARSVDAAALVSAG